MIDRSLISEKTRKEMEELRVMIERNVVLIPIVRCQNCFSIITIPGTNLTLYNKRYCSKWCEEQENPPEPLHTCSCGNSISSYLYKSGPRKGRRSGMFPKYCEECIGLGRHKLLCGRPDLIAKRKIKNKDA